MSHYRRSRETIHHRQDRCGRCRSTGISDARTASKQTTDIELMPKAVTVTHMCCECVCSDCDAVTATKPPGIKGTPLGPSLPTFLTSVWGKAVSAGSTIALLNGTFGTGMCKTAVKHAQAAPSCRLQHTAGEMHVSLSKSPHIKMGETPIRIGGRRRYVWAYIGDAVVLIKMGLEE